MSLQFSLWIRNDCWNSGHSRILNEVNYVNFAFIFFRLVGRQDFVKFTENFNYEIEVNLETILQEYIFYLLVLFGVMCFFIITFTKFMFYPLEYMKKTAINKVLQNSSKIHQIPAIYE